MSRGGVLATLLAQTAGGGGGSGLPYSTNLLAHLRADLGVTLDGSTRIQVWLDQSASAYTFQTPNAIDRPDFVASVAALNGHPAARFTTVGSTGKHTRNWTGVNCAPLTADNWTLIAVVVPSDQSVVRQGALFCGDVAGGGRGYAIAPSGLIAGRVSTRYQNVAWNDTTTALTNGTPVILCDVRASGTLTEFQNNTALAPTFTNVPNYAPPGDFSQNSNGIMVGRIPNNNSFRGDIAEILVYNEALSAGNRSLVHAYLGARYGITVAP